jgi:hypothetical protein
VATCWSTRHKPSGKAKKSRWGPLVQAAGLPAMTAPRKPWVCRAKAAGWCASEHRAHGWKTTCVPASRGLRSPPHGAHDGRDGRDGRDARDLRPLPPFREPSDLQSRVSLVIHGRRVLRESPHGLRPLRSCRGLLRLRLHRHRHHAQKMRQMRLQMLWQRRGEGFEFWSDNLQANRPCFLTLIAGQAVTGCSSVALPRPSRPSRLARLGLLQRSMLASPQKKPRPAKC